MQRACRPLSAAIFGALVGVASSCTSEPVISGPRVDQKYLTGAAAAAINSKGQFNLPAPSPGPYPEITSDRAVVLANAFLHDYGPLWLGRWEQEHGAPLPLSNLSPCPRQFYARSPYLPLPAAVSSTMRKVLGGFWIVTYCDGSAAAVMIAVSSFATDVQVGTGAVELSDAGVNFYSVGVPAGGAYPPAPEVSANLMASQVGVRVSQVPQLLLRPWPYAPWAAVWRIGLEIPVSVTGAHGTRERQWLEVGYNPAVTLPQLLDADPDLADSTTQAFIDPAGARSDGLDYTFVAELQPDISLGYESVRVTVNASNEVPDSSP